jgi:hypothetical protein
MSSYQIELREVRLATDGTDDVALFDVRRNEDGETWIVPAMVSPLFRLINMRATVSDEGRRAMVGGLGARAIVERLNRGAEGESLTESLEEPLLFSLDYPGAPDEPKPLPEFETVTIEVDDGSGA